MLKNIWKTAYHSIKKTNIATRILITKINVHIKLINVFFCSIPTLPAIALTKNSTTNDKDNEKIIISTADDLYSRNEVDQLYTYLSQHCQSSSADVLWRLARATCDKAKATEDKTKRKDLMMEAMDSVRLALYIDPDNYACHKWYAIMLDYVGEYEGTKERISKAFIIRSHFEKAIDLNPKDATSVHLLGYWCFVFADLPWYQRKMASIVFATPPTSTYQEALELFLKAEDVSPGFYSTNLLMIGKTYLRLNDSERAKEYLERAFYSPIITPDDKKANKEAESLLKSL